MFDLNGRCAVVTGAASCIGLTIAERVATGGANVVLIDLNQIRLEASIVGIF